uniref:Major facilitator superfamily (MFS) profile domain-containing protein n=1 Tax=Tetradesmus obliquus TaxID=3088 RepID=A0A383VW07_TETOB|eukprot:jgi/Sobl393_1/16791/SZX69665.1
MTKQQDGTRLVLNVDARAHYSPTHAEGIGDPFSAGCEPEQVVAALQEGDAEAETQGISFDDALSKYVGEFGKGQVAIYVSACLLQIPNAVLILLMVFSLGSPITSRSWACTADAAADPACAAVYLKPDTAGFCALSPSQWTWTSPNHGFVSKFNLICAEQWKSQLANSFFFVGYLIGSGVCGVVADAYGRKVVAFVATALAALFTAAALGVTNYWVLMVLRLLTGIGVAGQALGSFMLSTEMLGPTWRGVAGIITQVFFIVGEFALVIIAVVLPSWRGQFAAGAVLCAAALLLWPLVPESGRWLYVQGHTDEAMEQMAAVARRNGSRPPMEPLAAVRNGGSPASDQTQQTTADASAQAGPATAAVPARKLSLALALKDRHIARRFFILAYAWMVLCMVYYGISFALGSIGSSLVMSFCIAAIAELPSYLIAAWAIERWGRHNTMASGMLLGGLACIGCAVTPSATGRAALAAVGKFGIAGSFAIASIYTSELFPTLIRSAVLGYQNQAARVGGIIAPFIVMAGAASGGGGNSNLVPFATFGAAALLAGLLIFSLPETLGVPLPDTLQDMENIASVFTNKTWQRGGFKAATKSMFKTKVDFKKKKPARQPPVLPTLQESTPPQQLCCDGLAGNMLAGNSSSNSVGSAAAEGSTKGSLAGSNANDSRKSLLSAGIASSDAAAEPAVGSA